MNSLVSSIGTNAFALLQAVADAFGDTRLAPSSITYYSKKTVAYDPDGQTITWNKTVTVSDCLVGHTRKAKEAGESQIDWSDIVVIFPSSNLSNEPQQGDEVSFNSETYEYVKHQLAVGVYCVGLRKPDSGS